MRRERLFLLEIVRAADAISRFLATTNQESFLADELLQSAVLHKLTVIGEAVARLPEGLRQRYPDIPWRGVAAFRNIAVHAYFSVDWTLVWIAATHDTPLLREQISAVLPGFPDDDTPAPAV